VNGHVIIMTSPIDGIVTLAPPPVMQSVTAGSTLKGATTTWTGWTGPSWWP
jgi:hypothetical protein